MRLLPLALMSLLPSLALASPYYSYPVAGPLTGAEVLGPIRQGNQDVTVRLGQLGILGNQGVSYDDPAGLVLSNGGLAITKSSYGWQGTATGLSVILDGSQPFPQVNGNFGVNPASRSLSWAADHVGTYTYAAVQPPVATITLPAFTYANDPVTPFFEWYYWTADGTGSCNLGAGSQGPHAALVPVGNTGMVAPPCGTTPGSIPATGTVLNFNPPLSASVVAQLQPNMLVETRDSFMTAAITSWDPGGAWIKVDTWSLLIANSSSYVYNGFTPATLGPGGQTIDINPFHNTYLFNGGVTVPANAYTDPETNQAGASFLAEYYVSNNWGQPTYSEYNSLQDQPRQRGWDLGCTGTFGCGNAFTAGGAFRRGFDCTGGYPTYACLVAEADPAGQQNGALMVDQRSSGSSYVIKNTSGVQKYLVDRFSGMTFQSQNPAHFAWNGVLFSIGGSVFTQDGSAPVSGVNTVPPALPGYDYTVRATVECSDHTNSATWVMTANVVYAASSNTSFTIMASGTGAPMIAMGSASSWFAGWPYTGTSILAPYVTGVGSGTNCTAKFEQIGSI